MDQLHGLKCGHQRKISVPGFALVFVFTIVVVVSDGTILIVTSQRQKQNYHLNNAVGPQNLRVGGEYK